MEKEPKALLCEKLLKFPKFHNICPKFPMKIPRYLDSYADLVRRDAIVESANVSSRVQGASSFKITKFA
jgi:hypothetical protein